MTAEYQTKMRIWKSALGFLFIVAVPAFAQQAPGQMPLTDADVYPQPPSIVAMQAYFGEHPELVDLIRTHPEVINTPEFLTLQPRIAMFLNDHPEIKAEVQKNPGIFLSRAYDTQPKLERGQDPDLDSYLAHHPRVAQQIRDNPKLIDDLAFLKSHPPLQSYMIDHPEVHQELKDNPNRFIHQDLPK